MENDKILEAIECSDMVLVGLGEEFDNQRMLGQDAKYRKGCGILEEVELHWLIPAWNEFCSEKAGSHGVDEALEKLGELLANKNYFIVSISSCSEVHNRFGMGEAKERRVASSRGERLVMPCGSLLKKQCSGGCEEILTDVTQEDREKLRCIFEEMYRGGLRKDAQFCLGICPECGAQLILNNIYAEQYNEKGYLDQWLRYRKWLQGTLNRRIFILELGVGMRFPSVIRWPFEKVAFYNQKAYFCRVNENLYQLTEELAEKGCGISQNAIDWLCKL